MHWQSESEPVASEPPTPRPGRRPNRRLALVAIALSSVAASCILLTVPPQLPVKLASWAQKAQRQVAAVLTSLAAQDSKSEEKKEQQQQEDVTEEADKMLARFRAAQRKQEALVEATETPALLRHLYHGSQSKIPLTGLLAHKPETSASVASVRCLTDRCLTEARDKSIKEQNAAIKVLEHQHHLVKLGRRAEPTVNDMREDEVLRLSNRTVARLSDCVCAFPSFSRFVFSSHDTRRAFSQALRLNREPRFPRHLIKTKVHHNVCTMCTVPEMEGGAATRRSISSPSGGRRIWRQGARQTKDGCVRGPIQGSCR